MVVQWQVLKILTILLVDTFFNKYPQFQFFVFHVSLTAIYQMSDYVLFFFYFKS
jgi:hypothetical protein